MRRAEVRFYSELNEFVAPWRRGRATTYEFDVSGSVKDMIEALGVPHTEIDLVLANSKSVDFSYRVNDGDRISAYPPFETIDISSQLRLRPRLLRHLCFVADTHLGRLAAYLRIAGFDTLYRPDYRDAELAQLSANQNRILLTRDRGLLKRTMVTRGYCIRSTVPRDQFAETVQRFDLSGSIAPFQRCVHCNELLQPARKELIGDRLPLETKRYFQEFSICPGCNQIYWKGSHYRRMQRLIESVIRSKKDLPDG